MGNRITPEMKTFTFFLINCHSIKHILFWTQPLAVAKTLRFEEFAWNVFKGLCAHIREPDYMVAFSCPVICHRKLFFHINSIYWNYLVNHLFSMLWERGIHFMKSSKSWNSSKTGEFSQTVVVQSLSHVWFLSTLRTAAHQASLFITISQSLLKLISAEPVMPSNHLILCHPLLPLLIFPSIRVFFSE